MAKSAERAMGEQSAPYGLHQREGRYHMAASDTKSELLRHLDSATRSLDPSNLAPFTTAHIAAGVSISRNLASQYLNELVRDGLIIKINTRPVIFMHRRGVERYLQTTLDRCEFESVKDLMSVIGFGGHRDFDSAIGYDLSLATCVEQLKSAISYPPHGLPVLLVGEPGTGKALLSRLMFAYGVNVDAFPAGAKYVAVDCSRYADDDARFRHDLLGVQGLAGYLNETAGGLLYLSNFDRLSRASRDHVMERLHHGSEKALHGTMATRPVHIVLSTSLSAEDPVTRQITHRVPLVASVPALRDRTVEERTDLAMHFLRMEGRCVAADVAISRGALRTLVEASFEDNVDGLRACITNCCAGAYLNRTDERLVIRSYNLPAQVLGATAVQEDDDELVSGDKRISPGAASRSLRFFQAILDAFRAYRDGNSDFDDFFQSACSQLREYQDYLNFESRVTNPRLAAYEQVLNPVFEQVGSAYGIELSRKSCHALAQTLCIQLWGEAGVARWRTANAADIQALLMTLTRYSRTATVIVEQIGAEVTNALGVKLDDLSQALLLIEMKDVCDTAREGRGNVGIILAHGYSTATSIADAANRILRRRVFDAIDMAYDEQLSDVTGQLSRLLERYAYAQTVAVLVDMGSLSEVDKAIHGLANGDLYIVNNVSTGLALEVGSALISGDDLSEVLDRSIEAVTPAYRIIRGAHGYDAIAFCSENGQDAADRIRRLVAASLPDEMAVRLVTTDFADLVRNGCGATVFGSYRVRAIMGTMDPGISDVPFVGIEDILANGSSEALDRALMNELGPEGIAQFHRDLLKNVTLRNVVESITILNPERLYAEADHALAHLQERMGRRIEQRKVIGIYVHLCGLIERLVTKNFVEAHPDEDFAAEHPDFVAWFRESFRDLSQRYKVEVPTSEIAYVYDFIFGNAAAKPPAGGEGTWDDVLADE